MTIISHGGAELTEAGMRNNTSLLLLPGLNPLEAVDGVHSGLGITKTSGMDFEIGIGRAAVNGASPTDGAYTAALVAPEPMAFTPGDATLNRIDLVVLQTYPNSSTPVVLEVVEGALSAGAAVAPAVPAGALPLWEVPIPAGTSAGNGGWDAAQARDRRPSIGTSRFVDYTPTWVGIANLGSGFVSLGRYRRNGDSIFMQAKLVGGAGASLGTLSQTVAASLPIPRAGVFSSFGRGILVNPAEGYLYRDIVVTCRTSTTADCFAQHYGTGASPGSLRRLHDLNYPFQQGTEISIQLEYTADPNYLG